MCDVLLLERERVFALATDAALGGNVDAMGKGRALLLAVVAATAAVVEASSAAAQSSVAAAAKAFSLGQQAELAGDFRAASEHYELADRMVPSPEALRSAVKTRLKAGDAAIAATHAETLARRYRDERSQAIAADLLKGLRPKLARVSLSCTPSCGALADGGAIGVEQATEHVFYLEPGQHTVAADFGAAGSRRQVVDARAGKTVAVDLAAPPQAPAAVTTDPGADVKVDASSARSPGLSRAWFVAGLGVTVGLAGATIWSGLDVLDRNNKYEQDPTLARLEDGQSAERRTNILIGATAAAAVGTGVIAFFTRWSPAGGDAEAAPVMSVAPVDGGAIVVFEGGFR
jgi:hypothetical protein